LAAEEEVAASVAAAVAEDSVMRVHRTLSLRREYLSIPARVRQYVN
jgi:hypothetical protein